MARPKAKDDARQARVGHQGGRIAIASCRGNRGDGAAGDAFDGAYDFTD
jgi:hypothetical protein